MAPAIRPSACDGDDLWTFQGSDGVGFPDEALPKGIVGGVLGAQEFQGISAGQARMLTQIGGQG